MPFFEVFIEPRWDRQRRAEGRLIPRIQPECRRDEPAHDSAVEAIAGDADTLRAYNRAFSTESGGEADKGKVACSPAEIGDQHQFLAVESRLVLARGRDRLEDKRYLLEAGGLERRAQASDGEVVVALRFRAAEVNGPSDDNAAPDFP